MFFVGVAAAVSVTISSLFVHFVRCRLVNAFPNGLSENTFVEAGMLGNTCISCWSSRSFYLLFLLGVRFFCGIPEVHQCITWRRRW
jgi:hypothetical protein